MRENTRGGDTTISKITRTVSAGWLFSIVVSMVGWGVSNYFAFMKWADATDRNVTELRRLSVQMNAKDVKDEGITTRIAEHERRIGVLEAKK